MTSYNYDIKNKSSTTKVRELFKCSNNEKHKLTKKQAKNSSWFCTHCGAPLLARTHKLQELKALANELQIAEQVQT